ncbi:MAG: methyl-accepting chemotaxis protein [Pseudomonadota bacterium]
MKAFRRKPVNLTIKSRLQARMLTHLGLQLLVSVGVGAAVFYFLGNQELGNTLHMAHLRVSKVHDLLLPVLGATAAVALILGFMTSLFFPLRVVGPLPKFEAALRRLESGDFTAEVALREGDILRELADSFNSASMRLCNRVGEMQERARKLRREVERLAEQRPDLKDAIVPLQAMSQQISEELDGFQTRT